MASLPPRFYSQRLNPHSIRLLTLEPLPEGSASSAPLVCKSSEHVLSELPQYVALSYEWGSKADLQTIVLDGQPQSIRPNLHKFLGRLRGKEALKIWADAICIEQSDDIERTQQVAIMGDIYRSAQGVFAWLGDSGDRSDEVIDTLTALDKESTILDKTRRNEVVNIFYRKGLAESLYRFCIRGYWERTWIVQEVALPQTVVLYCGDRQLSCNILKEVCSGWSIQSGKQKKWRHWSEKPYFELLDTVSRAMIFPDTETARLRIEPSVMIAGYDDHRPAERPHQTFGGRVAGPHMTYSRFVGDHNWHPELLPMLNMEYSERFGIHRRDPETEYGLLLDESEGWASFVEGKVITLSEEGFDPKLASSTIMTFWAFLVQTHAGKVLQARVENESRKLDEIISTYETWKCSDVRDHIYAMLSMAADYQAAIKASAGHQLALKPDYTKSAAWLLLEVVQFCMPEDPITFARTLTEALKVDLKGLSSRPLDKTLVEHVMKISKRQTAANVRSEMTIRTKKAGFLLSDLTPRRLKTSVDDLVKVFALKPSAWSGPNRQLLSQVMQDIDEPYIETSKPPYYLIPDKLCLLTVDPASDDTVFHLETGELFMVARPREDSVSYQCIGFGGIPEAYSSVRWSPVLREHILHLTWWLSKSPIIILPCREHPPEYMADMPVPVFYLLLDTGTQAGQSMRFTSSNGWPHPDAKVRRALWKGTLHGPREGFDIFGDSPMDKWWAGEVAELENVPISGWPGTKFKESYF